jgi:nitrogen fixation protein NifQ
VGLESAEIGRRLAVRFMLKVELDRIADARYEVFGCGFSMAACAVAADLAVGYRLNEVATIDANSLDTALDGLPAERRYCADLAVEALHSAARCALDGRKTIVATVPDTVEHGPRITTDHRVYKLLMKTPQPDYIAEEDRHLFACLASIVSDEACDMALALGLDDCDLDSILLLFFPGVDRMSLVSRSYAAGTLPPPPSTDILSILYSHVPVDRGFNQFLVSLWLARILATRTALPGHLWVAMGLTERPQLTSAIRRHLPTLADANNQSMRWKRYLFKQVCDLKGGEMCKVPNCGECSDYSLCFAEEL